MMPSSSISVHSGGGAASDQPELTDRRFSLSLLILSGSQKGLSAAHNHHILGGPTVNTPIIDVERYLQILVKTGSPGRSPLNRLRQKGSQRWENEFWIAL
jgi:hypothetical protein